MFITSDLTLTIRTYITKRIRWAFAAAMGAMLLLFVLSNLGDGKSALPFLIGFVPFLGLILYMNFGIRCPKCSGNVGITIAPHMTGWPGLGGKVISYCPFCGTSLDCVVESSR